MATLTGAAMAGEDGRLKAALEGGRLRVLDGARPVLTYQQQPVTGPEGTRPLFARGAYIYPLHAPNGAVLTDDFPKDHPHQRGVFFAWTKTRLTLDGEELHPDFWNLGSGTGRVRSLRVEGKVEDGGPLRFRAEHLWEARRGEAWEPVLDETWEVTFHPPRLARDAAPLEEPESLYLVDLVSRQTPRVEIELPEYRYGGMCVRASRQWVPKAAGSGAMTVLTSEGKDWKTAENTRARWVDMSGRIDGREAGIALLEHPETLGAPNLLRVPPEFPYSIFCPSKGGGVVLRKGKEHVFRYRIAAHNGLGNAARLEALWKEFTGA